MSDSLVRAGGVLAALLVASTVLMWPACVPTPAGAQGAAVLDTARIAAADKEPGNWLTHGRTYSEQRFSPLAEINRDTIGRLGLAWSYELRRPRGASATPIVIDGVMFVTSAWSVVHALDAGTGRELWVYDPNVERIVGADACCDVVNRGVAVYGDKVFVGVLDGRLVALRAKTGAVAWTTQTVDRSAPYTITGAPRTAHGLVYIGNGGAEYGVRGYVSAYDADSGALRWRFYTVPGDPAKGPDGAASDPIMAKAAGTWTGEWWTLGGGGTVWDAIVYDPDFDQLIIGVGNGAPWNQQVRSPGGGDNWFLSSIVALDARTGSYKWHYQTTPGETWDYTATQPIILADLSIEGQRRKVALQAPKNGFFYVVDRANGRLISAAPLLPMYPADATPPGMAVSWAHKIDVATGRPLENPEARYRAGTAYVRPGPLGVHNWHPMAFSPETGLIYIPVQELSSSYRTQSAFAPRRGLWNTGTARSGAVPNDSGRPVPTARASGYLIAWDPVAQREVWRVHHKAPWNGGTLATAGGLVFQGTVDGRFAAFDAQTGRQVWDQEHQMSTLAGPISYTVKGEQYVAALSGFGSVYVLIAGAAVQAAPVNGRVYAYKIGASAAKPVINRPSSPIPAPPVISASGEDLARGSALYAEFCSTCHGGGAAGGVITDLRRSSRLMDRAAWVGVVVEGRLRSIGMPGFSGHLSAAEADLIRAYVARQAAAAYGAQQKK